MEENCQLCVIHQQTYLVVSRTDYVYSIIPHAPLVPGHVMILPYSHTIFEELTPDELMELRDMSCQLKDQLVSKYPLTPPMLVSMMDTTHASIPRHFHSHLIPSPVNMRKLLQAYDPSILENEIRQPSELEMLAKQLR